MNHNYSRVRRQITPLAAVMSAVLAISTGPLAVSANAQSAPPSFEVQVLTLVAQAEHVERKCNAFTLEGQYVYREMKTRLLNTFNLPLFESISNGQAPAFAGDCADLARNADATRVVDYFNNEGARMLALHHFLAPNSSCPAANEPEFRQRADAQWKKLSGSADPQLQPAVMEQEAAIIASQCTITDMGMRARSHLASSMSRLLKPVYALPKGYGGEMGLKGTNPDAPTKLVGYRDPSRQIVKDGVLAGSYETDASRRVGVLRDGRLVVMIPADTGVADVKSVVFAAGDGEFVAAAAPSLDPRYTKVFLLDPKASNAVLLPQKPGSTFGIRFVTASGAVQAWEEQYEYRGRKKDDRGTSTRPIRFDPAAFRAAITYSTAPKFR